MLSIGRFLLAFTGAVLCSVLIIHSLSDPMYRGGLGESLELAGLIATFAFLPAVLATVLFGGRGKVSGTLGMVAFGAFTPLFALLTLVVVTGNDPREAFDSMTIDILLSFAPIGAISALVHALIWFNVNPKRPKTSD